MITIGIGVFDRRKSREMNRPKVLKVQDRTITIAEIDGQEYICLTDIVKGEEGNDHIKNWMRNRNTVEYLGMWEVVNNPDFKGVEFDTFRSQAGLNSFSLTPRKWIENTNAIGILSRAGKQGGTYAHKDIAIEFCTWLSPVFKLLVLKEFQKLKQKETEEGKWDMRRFVSKANYKIHTDSIAENIIPAKNLPKEKEGFVYAEEAEMLNVALFETTAKQWRAKHPKDHKAGLNIRDFANTHQLIVLSNLESYNAELIRQQMVQSERLKMLRNMAIAQLTSLANSTDTMNLMIESPMVSKGVEFDTFRRG